jgi:hypothetical protein
VPAEIVYLKENLLPPPQVSLAMMALLSCMSQLKHRNQEEKKSFIGIIHIVNWNNCKQR